jgi:hypothetical protein
LREQCGTGSISDEVLREQTKLDGLANELSDIAHFETMHQIEPMDLDRSDTDAELLRNFTIGHTLNDQGEDLLLPRCHWTRNASERSPGA